MYQTQKYNWQVKLSVWLLCAFCLIIQLGCRARKTEQLPERSRTAFAVEKDSNGKYWFADPQGEKFLSKGINHIISYPFRPKPETDFYDPVNKVFAGDYDRWKTDVIKLVQGAGFNTIGSWSDPKLFNNDSMYGTICVYVAKHHLERCMDGFLPDFEQKVRENVEFALKDYENIDNVFGVFLDNEMKWYGASAWTIVPNYTVLESGLKSRDDPYYGQNSPYYKIVSDYLKKKYQTVDAFSRAWGKSITSWDELSFDFARSCFSDQANADRDEFTALAAEKFYSHAAGVVREMLPGKLILGTRFAQRAPEGVIRACGKYCDVISFNDYRKLPETDDDLLAKYWIWGGKPLMVTEYSWRAEENSSGNPNTGGAGVVVKTQAERAENYQKYVEDLLSQPMVIGAHWFEFADQSPQGRFDGENSNYGIVDINHRPYTELLAVMKRTNDNVEKLHARSDRQVPISLPKPRAVVFEPGQQPGRPPSMDLLKITPVKEPELFYAPDAKIELKGNTDHWVVPINTGNEWGCGVLFFGPEEFKNSSGPEYSTNLDGYYVIELDAVISKEIVFDLFLDEAGVAAPDAVSYDLSAGDDAEGFLIPAIQGRQERFLYRFELKDLQPRKDWGNQKGLRKVDIHAMKGVALFFHGGQGKDQIQIFSLKLVR